MWMFVGQAVHDETAAALERAYPGRFAYNRIGPDFLDNATGDAIELTTRGEVTRHMARGAAYRAAQYATYELP